MCFGQEHQLEDKDSEQQTKSGGSSFDRRSDKQANTRAITPKRTHAATRSFVFMCSGSKAKSGLISFNDVACLRERGRTNPPLTVWTDGSSLHHSRLTNTLVREPVRVRVVCACVCVPVHVRVSVTGPKPALITRRVHYIWCNSTIMKSPSDKINSGVNMILSPLVTAGRLQLIS